MRLGSSILGGKPMRIPGIVDVYQVGDEWVARSWPKVANQPNSAAQLLWRKKFKDAHLKIKSLTGPFLDAWRAIECPPGKMWIDIAMRTLMRYPVAFNVPVLPVGIHLGLFEIENPSPGQKWKYFATWAYADGTDFPYNYMIQPFLYPSWDKALKWNDNGLICAKGKRPKRKWDLSYATVKAPVASYQTGDKMPASRVYWILANDAAVGITTVWIVFDAATASKKASSYLIFPPMYSTVEKWNGGYA